MDKFSKRDYDICPNCGEMKPLPVGVTPRQVEEGAWECEDCYNRSGKERAEEKSLERGQKEISKYDPEYEFLVKLVQLVTKEGIPAEEIRNLANAYPFQTIDDVGDLTAKIWTLATEKYKIPREWLEKKLGKTASLKISQPESGYVDNGKGYTCGRCAYFNKDKETCALVEGTIKAQGCCNYWDDKVKLKEEGTPSNKKEAGYVEYPDVDYRCDECAFFIAKEGKCSKVEGKISPTASCNLWAPMAKKKADLYQGQEESQDMLDHAPGYLAYQYGQEKESKPKGLSIDDIVQILNQKDPKIVRINTSTRTLDLIDGSTISFDDAVKRLLEQNKEGVFSGAEFSTNDVGVNPTMDIGPFSSPEDHGAKPQKKPFPNTNWLPAEDEETDEQPWSNVASSQTRPFSKKANPDQRYWIAPDGTAFPVQGAHSWWMLNNPDILKKYGVTPMRSKEDLQIAYQDMFDNGWIRISNEPMGKGFQIELRDLNNIPDYLNDFIAQHYKRGDTILIGNGRDPGIEVHDPFPTIQKVIKKRADLSGQTVNTILNTIQQNGGVTYNMGQGDMSGSNNFAVSAYPSRSQIVDGPVDFDTVEGYLETNKDLLTDSNNSLGVWSHEGKTYLDIVVTISNYDEAVDLAKKHNQIAIWDLRNNNEIPTGGTGEVAKTSEEQLLTQEDQNQIAADSSPAYVMAVNNYAEALKRGHGKDRSLEYAIESVGNVDKIDAKKLVEIINTYL